MDLQLSYTEPQLDIFYGPSEKFNIIPKGRRFGATQGGAHACIEWALEDDGPTLWVDTVHGNIDRYYERYFEPPLERSSLSWDYNKQKRLLKIENSYIDFRSADRPENIEGFGYRRVILNEAGIILKNDYLYTNSILPMLLDYPDSQLWALGVPKGQLRKDGEEHRYYTLYKRALEGAEGYRILQYTSYDNPLLRPGDIQKLEDEIMAMSPQDVDQEIYGKFIERAGSNPFAHRYDKNRHLSKLAIYDPRKTIYVGMDFNLNPFGFVFAHVWEDRDGIHCYVFDEASIDNANLDDGIEYIKKMYGKGIYKMIVTGDSMGSKRDFGQKDHASYYDRIQRSLRLGDRQIQVPANPTHANSRDDVNFALVHADIKIHPSACKNLARDLLTVQCDAFGSIQKKNRKDLSQRADHLDAFRYLVNAFLFDWIRKRRL